MRIEDIFTTIDLSEAKQTWQKHKNPRAGGMSKKAVRSYRRSNPGSKIQTAVTTKPSKLKKGSKASKRRLSFCRRMRGMKKKRTSAKTARDPNSAINKSLRRWNCESVQDMQELVMIAEQRIQALRESLRDDEHHRVRVTLDDGSEKTVRIKTDEGFREQIKRYFAQRGREVVDIDVDWGVRMDEKKDRSPGKITKSEDPCWSGYHMVGTKKKGGREVPNCVPGKKGD